MRAVAFVLAFALGFVPLSSAFADCFDEAASYQGVNVGKLKAIAIKESTSCRNVVRRNTDGSNDYGCMQINSVHFPDLAKYGVRPEDLMHQCKNIYVAAWHYKNMIMKYGDNWLAVGGYHSKKPSLRDAYAADVYKIWLKYGLNRY